MSIETGSNPRNEWEMSELISDAAKKAATQMLEAGLASIEIEDGKFTVSKEPAGSMSSFVFEGETFFIALNTKT